MENQEKLLLNEREAAQLLSMSNHFLRRDRISSSSVGIPYVRVGAAVRYRRVDLEAWIERQMQEQAAQVNSPIAVVEEPIQRGRGRPRKKTPARSNTNGRTKQAASAIADRCAHFDQELRADRARG